MRKFRKTYYYGKRRQRIEHVMAVIRTIGTLVVIGLQCYILTHFK